MIIIQSINYSRKTTQFFIFLFLIQLKPSSLDISVCLRALGPAGALFLQQIWFCAYCVLCPGCLGGGGLVVSSAGS